MIVVGNYVRIRKTKKPTYQDTIGCIGVVKDIKTYDKTNSTTFYVDLINHGHNSEQENGWFLFNEDDLENFELFNTTTITPMATTMTASDIVDTMKYGLERLDWYNKNYKWIVIDDITKKEKKEMKLLEIYFDKRKVELNKLYSDKKKEVHAQNQAVKDCAKMKKELEEKYKDLCSISFVVKSTEDEDKKIHELTIEEAQKEVELSCLRHEIEAQLEICETYDQKISVLKTYNVIDENGVLNV